jgi:hypothetical protein
VDDVWERSRRGWSARDSLRFRSLWSAPLE